MHLNCVKSGYYSIFVSVSETCWCVFFWNAHKSSRCVCGRGISQWCLQHFVAPVISQRGVIDYSDHGTDCFTPISLWPYRWEITSAAGRTIGGKRDGILIYHPIITGLSGRTGGNERGRDKRMGRKGEGEQNRDKQREREKRGINQQGRRMRERAKRLRNDEKQEPKLRPNSDVYFIWGGRCAWSTTSQCFSGPFSLAVWLA